MAALGPPDAGDVGPHDDVFGPALLEGMQATVTDKRLPVGFMTRPLTHSCLSATEYTGLVLRKDGSVLASTDEVSVKSQVWTGPVRFLLRCRFAWKPLRWPPRELVELMSNEKPLVAPDGSGVWFHAPTGYTAVLMKKGLVPWIERRDIRPDLIRYVERRGQTTRRTPSC